MGCFVSHYNFLDVCSIFDKLWKLDFKNRACHAFDQCSDQKFELGSMSGQAHGIGFDYMKKQTITINNIYCTGTKPSLPIVIFSSTIGFKYLISMEHKSSNSSTKGARTLPSDIM